MLTNFGKECRKIRMDSDELLATMAEKLKVSSSFLSAVENGKKSVPSKWPELIIELYQLNEETGGILKDAAVLSQKKVEIGMDALSDGSKNLVLSFARNIENLNQTDRAKILKILSKN